MHTYTRFLSAFLLLLCPLLLSAKAAVQNTRQQKPLSFTENKGQVTDQFRHSRKDIDFKLDAPGLSIFVGDGQLHYQWFREQEAGAVGRKDNSHSASSIKHPVSNIKSYRMDVTLIGANLNAEVIAGEQQAYYERYYSELFGEEGAFVHTFNRITYKNIYPHIDWVLYSKDNQLKYDFIVHPGGKVSDIKLKYEGATKLELKDGALMAETPIGSITEEKPYTYDATTHRELTSSFVLNGNVLSYNISANGGTIIIDPTIFWGTYYGGNFNDFCFDVASDEVGNSFIAGMACSMNNIATTGAFQVAFGGLATNIFDAFVAKFNAAGIRLWGTYYGGQDDERFSSVAYDIVSDNIYLAGRVGSPGLATAGAHQATFVPTPTNKGENILVKFNSKGSRLWATYYGGSKDELAGDVACDGLGNVYLAAATASPNNIATAGSHQSAAGGETDAYLVKFNSNGVRQWGTFYGDSGDDYFVNVLVACDVSNNVYIGSGTNSTSGIATTGSHQSAIGSNTNYDGFLVKFNSNGVRQWGTYYGGATLDYIASIACDGNSNIIVNGTTTSISGIVTAGAYQSSLNAGVNTTKSDGFLVKFNSNGVRQWGTYYGGGDNDQMFDVSVASNGTIYSSGMTASNSGIATSNGYQAVYGGAWDDFLAEWSPAGTLAWATYYGGIGTEFFGELKGCSWSPAGYVFLAATTLSSADIATSSGHQATKGSGSDGFLASFVVDTVVYVKELFTDTVFCPGDSFKLPYGVIPGFAAGNVFTAQLSDATGSFASPVNIGTRTLSVADTIKCQVPFNTPQGSGYSIRIIATSPAYISGGNALPIRVKAGPVNLAASYNAPLCEGSTLNLSANTTATVPVSYSWTGPLTFTSSQQNPSVTGTTTAHSGDYILTATSDGCTAKDTAAVVVNIIPAVPAITSNAPVCPGTTLNLSATSATTGSSYNWNGPASFISILQNPSIANISSVNAGTYSVTASKAGCTSAPATANIIVHPLTPKPITAGSIIACAGAALNLTAYSIPGATYSWTGPGGYSSSQQNPVINPVQPSYAGMYIVVATNNGCLSEPDTVNVTVNPASKLGAYVSPNDTICIGATATFVAMPNNGGPAPLYQWYKNGLPITGATNTQYATSNIVTGDIFHCVMTSTGVCTTPIQTSSDPIVMTVLPIVNTPTVKITSVPVNPRAKELVTFTAIVTHGGPAPQYQWQVNGQNMGGAIYSTWSAATLQPFDKVNCIVISNDPCATNKTAYSDTILIGFPTHVNSIANGRRLVLYPNPNAGSFTIEADMTGKVKLEVLNAVGQLVHNQVATAKAGRLEEWIALPGIAGGMYLLKLMDEEGQASYIRFSVSR